MTKIGECSSDAKRGIPGSISLMINKGNGSFEATYPSEFQNIGMITDMEFIDLNSDEKGDLIVVGEWMPILAFLNNESSWESISESIGFEETDGMWQSIETSDLNGDGVPDLVAHPAVLSDPINLEIDVGGGDQMSQKSVSQSIGTTLWDAFGELLLGIFEGDLLLRLWDVR